MSRFAVGVLGGVIFGVVAVLSSLPLEFADKGAALTAAFLNRFAIASPSAPSSRIPVGHASRSRLALGEVFTMSSDRLVAPASPLPLPDVKTVQADAGAADGEYGTGVTADQETAGTPGGVMRLGAGGMTPRGG